MGIGGRVGAGAIPARGGVAAGAIPARPITAPTPVTGAASGVVDSHAVETVTSAWCPRLKEVVLYCEGVGMIGRNEGPGESAVR